MVKRRRERFFASAARGKRGKWGTEDWYYTIAVVFLIFLGLYLAEVYKPGQFVEPYQIVEEELTYYQ